MLHAYITLYGICFMATVVIIILLLLVGTKIDIEEARHYGAEVEPPPTAKDWIAYFQHLQMIIIKTGGKEHGNIMRMG